MEKFKTFLMIATLMLCFTAVGCSDDDDNPEEPTFEKVDYTITIKASSGAKSIATFSGNVIGFDGEEAVTSDEIYLINFADSNTFDLTSLYDQFPMSATINVSAAENENFTPQDGAELDVEFGIEIDVEIIDNEGGIMASGSKTYESNIMGADSTVELQELYVGRFPLEYTITIDEDFNISFN